MRKLAPIIILAVLLACRLPPSDVTPIPPPIDSRSVKLEPGLEQAAGLASVTDLLISGLPPEIYQTARKEYVTADTTLTNTLSQAGYTLLVFDGLVNMVIGEGSKRLCVMPYPKNTTSIKDAQSDSPLAFIGHLYGQAVYGLSNPPTGVDSKDRPEVTVVEAVPLDELPPDLRCALVRVNANNPFFTPGSLQILLVNIFNREIAGSLPAEHTPQEKSILRWNIPLARPELVEESLTGKFDRQLFKLKGCYTTPSPTTAPTPASATSRPATLTPKPAPVNSSFRLPLTKDGKFDFLADLAAWPRITTQAELTRYVAEVKHLLAQPWSKPVCQFPSGPYEQTGRTQYIYYDYPVCLCSQEPPYKKIAGFIIEQSGYAPMYGIISQVWTASGTRYYTALGDLNNSGLANPEKRAVLTNGGSYLSVFGGYSKPPGGTMPSPTLTEQPVMFMLANGWITLDEYNSAFRTWVISTVPPVYFEDHPASGEITEFFIRWQ